MNRILRGAVVFAASALVWACNTEPEALEGGVPDKIVADPEIVFIDLGDTEQILLRLVDQQGTSLTAEIGVAAASAAVTVTADPLFRPVYGPDGTLQANTNNTELRVLIAGAAVGATSLTVTSEDKTLTIPVIVLPTEIDPLLSNLTPDVGEPVTLTAPAGFTFNANSTITYATGEPAQILSAEPTVITFLPVPGSGGTMTVTNVTPDFAPGLSIPFDATTTTDPTDVSLLSSTDPATAPAFNAPALGETVVLNDNSYATDQFYKIVTTEANTILEFEFDWDGTADLDFLMRDETFTTTIPGGGAAQTGAHPEVLTVTVAAPGTYTIRANLYAGGPPNFLRITTTRVAPEEL